MAKLSNQEFYDKWVPLLADNVFQDIDGARFEQLLADLRDSFASADSQRLQPVAPAVNFDPVLRQLTATHLLGTLELEYNQHNGGFTAYAPIQVDELGHGQGEWRFRVKAAAGRNPSQTTDSPLIESKGTANPAGPGKIKAADISDSTEAGRALLTAQDVAAQRKLLDNFVILAGQYGVGQPRFEHTTGEDGLYAYLLRALSSVGAPAAPTDGQVDDLGDVFSFQPPAGYSFAQLKIAGLPSTTGAEWLNAANSYVQNGRVYVRVFGAVPAGGLAVYVGASGNVPDGQVLTNNAAFTANSLVPTVPGALAVDFVVDNASLSPGDTLTFTAKASGGTAPYEHSVQALNPDTGAVVVIATASTPNLIGAWEKVQPGVYLVTDAVTDATGDSLVSATRRVVVAAPGSGGGTLVPATRTRLGGVRIGEGLTITEEGLLSSDTAGLLAGNNTWTNDNTFERFITALDFVSPIGRPGFDSLVGIGNSLDNLQYDTYQVFDESSLAVVVRSIGRWPRGYDSLQEAISFSSYYLGTTINLQADAPGVTVIDRPCVIHCGVHKIGGLSIQNGAIVYLYGAVDSVAKEAIYISSGELYHWGNTTHTSNVADTKTVTIYPSGKYYGRGTLTLNSTDSGAFGIVTAAYEGEVDWDGLIVVTNKGCPLSPQFNTARIAGAIVSADKGVNLARGRCDLFCSIDTRKSSSNSPALTVTQIKDAADYGEYHHLHAGTALLSPDGVPSIVYGNAAIGAHLVFAEASVVYTKLPDPEQVVVRVVGATFGGGSAVGGPVKTVNGEAPDAAGNVQLAVGGPGGGVATVNGEKPDAAGNVVVPTGITVVEARAGNLLTFKRDGEYGPLASGSYEVDLTGAQVGVTVFAEATAAASAPVLNDNFELVGGRFIPGKRHEYAFRVANSGKIHYVITQLP